MAYISKIYTCTPNTHRKILLKRVSMKITLCIFTLSHIFMYSIYSLQVQLQVITLVIFKRKEKNNINGFPQFFLCLSPWLNSSNNIHGKEALINIDNFKKSIKSSTKLHFPEVLHLICKMLLKVNYFAADKAMLS